MGKKCSIGYTGKFLIDVDAKKHLSKGQKVRVTKNNQDQTAFIVTVRQADGAPPVSMTQEGPGLH